MVQRVIKMTEAMTASCFMPVQVPVLECQVQDDCGMNGQVAIRAEDRQQNDK